MPTELRLVMGNLRIGCQLLGLPLKRSLPGDNPDRAVSEAISAASADQPAFALAFTARDDYVEILKFLGRQILKFPKHLGVVITDQPVAELGFA
jgi:hypothetical protein